MDVSSDDEGNLDDDQNDESLATTLNLTVDRLERQLVFIGVEPQNDPALVSLIQASPLAMVKPSAETGNVMVLVDCNVYGETDHRPWLRKVPMAPVIFTRFFRCLLTAWHDTPEPECLRTGVIFVCISAGLERKRIFLKPLMNALKGKDENKNKVRTLSLYLSERSVRTRKGRSRGTIKLAQQIYMVYNNKTKIPPRKEYHTCTHTHTYIYIYIYI
jgi:hypothetical protein